MDINTLQPSPDSIQRDKRIKPRSWAASSLFIPELRTVPIHPIGMRTSTSAGSFDAHLLIQGLPEAFIEEQHLPVGQEMLEEPMGCIRLEQDIGSGLQEPEGGEETRREAAQGELSQREVLLGVTNQS